MGVGDYPRANLKWPVVIQNGKLSIEGVTLTLNPNQAYIRCAKPLKLYEVIEMTINVPVEDNLITTLRKLGQKDGIIRKKPLKKQDRIRITKGPMEDILGIFEYWTSEEGRVRVMLNFINCQASVELHYSFVEKRA